MSQGWSQRIAVRKMQSFFMFYDEIFPPNENSFVAEEQILKLQRINYSYLKKLRDSYNFYATDQCVSAMIYWLDFPYFKSERLHTYSKLYW